jgi:hypothetical protein
MQVIAGGGQYSRLVVVACHAVVRVTELENARTSDSAWYLLDYQKNQGYPSIITSHIQVCLRVPYAYVRLCSSPPRFYPYSFSHSSSPLSNP